MQGLGILQHFVLEEGLTSEAPFFVQNIRFSLEVTVRDWKAVFVPGKRYTVRVTVRPKCDFTDACTPSSYKHV